jgi:hypothetical protein
MRISSKIYPDIGRVTDLTVRITTRDDEDQSRPWQDQSSSEGFQALNRGSKRRRQTTFEGGARGAVAASIVITMAPGQDKGGGAQQAGQRAFY